MGLTQKEISNNSIDNCFIFDPNYLSIMEVAYTLKSDYKIALKT